jgi:hypothetical protein
MESVDDEVSGRACVSIELSDLSFPRKGSMFNVEVHSHGATDLSPLTQMLRWRWWLLRAVKSSGATPASLSFSSASLSPVEHRPHTMATPCHAQTP